MMNQAEGGLAATMVVPQAGVVPRVGSLKERSVENAKINIGCRHGPLGSYGCRLGP